MNKIYRLISLGAILLMATNILAYNITITAPANGTLTLSDGTSLTGTASAGATVTLIATPTPSLYYLEEIVIEPVIDLGNAQAPSKRASIPIATKIYINKTYRPTEFAENVAQNYGGSYTFTMPDADVSITATFLSTTNFEGNNNITVAIGGTGTYDGDNHSLVVKNTMPSEVILVEGTDFQITSRLINTGSGNASVEYIKDAGTYTFTIQGLGIYSNSKTVGEKVINKAPLTITPKNKSRQYRDANPTYTITTSTNPDCDFVYTGLQNGETNEELSTQPTVNIVDVNENSGVGTYTEKVEATGATANNYTITHGKGTLTITCRDVNSSNIAESNRAQATLSEVDATYADFNTDHYYKYDPNSVVTHQPSVNVIDPSDSNKELILNTDYTVAYDVEAYGDASCQTPGMYTAAVTFINNYQGNLIVKKYQIRKEVTLNNSSNFRWRTFYDPTYNIEVMDGFQAFTVHGINDNAVLLDNRTVIKAGMPMLLFKSGATYAGFYPPLIAPSDGRLDGWTSDSKYQCKVDVNGTPIEWDLSSDGGITGGTTKIWILVDDKFVRSKSGTLAAGKCYLDLSNTTYYAPMLNIGINLTGIDEIEARDTRTDHQFYDLSGRKVMNPTKGLYIVNGKKIIIK